MRRRRLARLAVLALLVALGLQAGPSRAHDRSYSYSTWTAAPGGARLELRLPARELASLPAARTEESLAADLSSRLRLESTGGPCGASAPPDRLPAPSGWVRYAWSLDCPEGTPRVLRSTLLLDVIPHHLHFVRWNGADGSAAERVLAAGDGEWPLVAGEERAAAGEPWSGYLWLGIEHIATGYDHLAFVIALLLLAGSLGEVATLVSGFTVAHSVTLALAVLGVVRPPTGAIESLIGLSIALVALENGWLLGGRGRAIPAATVGGLLAVSGLAAAGWIGLPPIVLLGVALFAVCHFGLLSRSARPARLRAAVALAFGLVHGFGFAGVLTELELPRARLLGALLGFNVGVEIGQLAIVLCGWPILRWVSRVRPAGHRLLIEGGSSAVLALGLYWFLTRALAS